MRRSDKIITARVKRQGNYLVVDMKSDSQMSYNPRIINRIDGLVFEDDIVKGYIFSSMNHGVHEINFFITENVSRSIDKKEFIRLVNHIVVDRMNEEISLFDEVKRKVEYDKLMDKVRYREYVICRYIAIGIIVEFLNRQVNDEYLARLYHMDRCTVIHATKELEKYGFTNQLKTIIDDIRAKVNELYESMKQPQKIEVFEFLEQ